MEIIKAKNFRIKKVKEVNGYWELYPKDGKKPLRLKTDLVYGKLPPVWKFPWQSHRLKLKVLLDRFIVGAEMDGLVLFEIPEEKYSPEAKQALAERRELDKKIEADEKEYAASIKLQLNEYLPKVPPVKDVEDEISKLPVCWLRYLKMYLPMQYGNKKEQQQLFLLYWVVSIANRLYMRHVDVESKFDTAYAALKISAQSDILDYSKEMILEIEKDSQYRNNDTFALYFEAQQELLRVLPKMSKQLEIYLNQTICRFLDAYAGDFSDLCLKRPYGLLGEPLDTDSEAYQKLFRQMKLPYVTTLITDKHFSNEDILRFNNHY